MTPTTPTQNPKRRGRGGAQAQPRRGGSSLKRLATAGAVAALALLSGSFALACSAEPDNSSSSTAATTAAASDAVKNAVDDLAPVVSTQNVSGGTLTTIQAPRQASNGGGSTTIYRSNDNGTGGGATIISSNSGSGGGGGIFTSTGGNGASGIISSGIGSFASTGAGSFNPFDAVFANGFGKK